MQGWVLIGLIVIQLLAPVAWAADSHAEALTGQHVDQTLPDGGTDSSCDHCCHASAHAVALLPDGASQQTMPTAPTRPSFAELPLSSRSPKPPTPPPNA